MPAQTAVFNPGRFVATDGIHESGIVGTPFLSRVIGSHIGGDFGELPKEDLVQNVEAMIAWDKDPDAYGRIMSVWTHESGNTIWLITENGSGGRVTTVLFPHEY